MTHGDRRGLARRGPHGPVPPAIRQGGAGRGGASRTLRPRPSPAPPPAPTRAGPPPGLKPPRPAGPAAAAARTGARPSVRRAAGECRAVPCRASPDPPRARLPKGLCTCILFPPALLSPPWADPRGAGRGLQPAGRRLPALACATPPPRAAWGSIEFSPEFSPALPPPQTHWRPRPACAGSETA